MIGGVVTGLATCSVCLCWLFVFFAGDLFGGGVGGSSSFDRNLLLLDGECFDPSPLTGDLEEDFSGVLIGDMLSPEGDLFAIFGDEWEFCLPGGDLLSLVARFCGVLGDE